MFHIVTIAATIATAIINMTINHAAINASAATTTTTTAIISAAATTTANKTVASNAGMNAVVANYHEYG